MVFYTYMYLREDGTPYYIGKGSGRRAYRQSHRRIKPPRNQDFILVQEFACEVDALAAEVFFIAYYGRKDLGTGVLRNRTEGGDNAHRTKYVVSAEQRQKLSAALKARGIAPTRLAQIAGGRIAGSLSKGKPWSEARRKAYEARAGV
jgi:hypothetical protein